MNLPDDPQLADAYQTLRRICDPDKHTVSVDAATTPVSTETGVNSDHLKRVIFEPLRRRDYITPRAGTLVVHPPSEVPR